jgi:hypothetical protein
LLAGGAYCQQLGVRGGVLTEVDGIGRFGNHVTIFNQHGAKRSAPGGNVMSGQLHGALQVHLIVTHENTST